MNNQPTTKLTEPTTNENGAGKESSSPTPNLVMFNAGGAGSCTAGDRCTAREG
jgi:hypothetical protein